MFGNLLRGIADELGIKLILGDFGIDITIADTFIEPIVETMIGGNLKSF